MYAVTFIDNITYVIEINEFQKSELPHSQFGDLEDVFKYISAFYKPNLNYSKRYYSIKHVENYVVFQEVDKKNINRINSHTGHFDTVLRAIYNELAFISQHRQ